MKKINFFDDFLGIQMWHDYLAVFTLVFMSVLPFLTQLISFVSKNNVVDSFISVSLPLSVFYLAFSFIYVPIIYQSLKIHELKKVFIYALICVLLFNFLNFISYLTFSKLLFSLPASHISKEKIFAINQELTIKILKKVENCELWKRLIVLSYFSFLSPFVEEVIFRLCVLRCLRNKIGVFSHLVVAVLFVICHMSYTSAITSELILIIPYFFLSIILSVTYEKLKTPTAGILARIIYNLVAVTASFNYRGIPPLTIILLNAGQPHRIY